MKKTVKRFEVQTVCGYVHYYFNKETKSFENEGCYSCYPQYYTWKTKEEMLKDFFAGFNAYELKNSLDSIIEICEITEIWTREDFDEEWDFDSEEKTVLISFEEYDWLKNNGMIREEV